MIKIKSSFTQLLIVEMNIIHFSSINETIF